MKNFTRPKQLKEGELLEDFSCGNTRIDNWVVTHAAHARRRATAVVYVSYCENRVAGFYTLSTHSVTRGDIGGGWLARNAPQQIPTVLLGMLGVDTDFKGLGLGAALLRDAYFNSLKVAELAGARALIVDPIDESARKFYLHFGFVELPNTNRMALKLR